VFVAKVAPPKPLFCCKASSSGSQSTLQYHNKVGCSNAEGRDGRRHEGVIWVEHSKNDDCDCAKRFKLARLVFAGDLL
jgi:hypothetical protein